jgi:hypothetical protein
MSPITWYSLEKEIHTQLNEKRKNNLFIYEEKVQLYHFLEHYRNHPEVFTPSMVLDLNIAVVSKITSRLSFSIEPDEFKKQYQDFFKLVRDKNPHNTANTYLHHIMSSHHFLDFENSVHLRTSKGKSARTSEIKQLQSDLDLFSTSVWHQDLKFIDIVKDIDPTQVEHTISSKNLIISLEKHFTSLSKDEDYHNFKNKYFEKFYEKLATYGNKIFMKNSFSEILSFLKDSYHEETLKTLVKVITNIPEYSYLKNKSAIDKFEQLHPQSKEILAPYKNEIRKDSIGDFFMESKHSIITISINYIAVEKTLLLDNVKKNVRASEIHENFIQLVLGERGKNNPFSYYLTTNDIRKSNKNFEVALLFNVPQKEIDEFGTQFIINFIKNQFLDFVDVYPNIKKDFNKYDTLWKECIIKKDIEHIPINNLSKPIKKF